jgi:hypothetical protein
MDSDASASPPPDLFGIASEAADASISMRSLGEQIFPDNFCDFEERQRQFWFVGEVIGGVNQLVRDIQFRQELQVPVAMVWMIVVLLGLFGVSFFGIFGFLLLPVCSFTSAFILFQNARDLPKLPSGSPRVQKMFARGGVPLSRIHRTLAMISTLDKGKADGLGVYTSAKDVSIMTLSSISFWLRNIPIAVLNIFVPIVLSVDLATAFTQGRNGWYDWVGIHILGW